jgi:hypothetical protein
MQLQQFGKSPKFVAREAGCVAHSHRQEGVQGAARYALSARVTALQGMPIVVEADDAPAVSFSAAAGGGEAVNLGVARAKGESKEEKKARKEAVKLQV